MKKVVCKVSGKEFWISDRDEAYYAQLGVPEPTLCPSERVRRRMAIRNERNLYHRESDLSGEKILSMYHPDLPYPVYSKEEWLSDKWDALDYGVDVDFGRSFFEQFAALQAHVPRANLALFHGVENSDFCNFVGDAKNSYLCFGSIFVEDCMYGNPYYSKNCLDCFLIRKSELCYECIDGEELYNCAYLQECYQCNDCAFGYDLRGCRDCVGCVGLRKKQYCIFNKQYSREDYEKFMKDFSFCDEEKVRVVESRLEELRREHPHRAAVLVNCENVSGNFLFNCKGCEDCFQISENEDCSYNIQTTTSRDCLDMNYTEENELCYEYMGNYRNYKAVFSAICYGCKDVWYCDYCTNCKNCFGCCGMKNAEFCILNKQYTEDEYHELVGRLIEMMKEFGEWGEFFPVKISPFAYNESVAMDYFPLSKDEALARGYRWRELDNSEFKPATIASVPREIDEVDDAILNEVLACEVSGRNYKIMPGELRFYRRMKLPIPRKHFVERLKARMSKRPPYELFERKCDKCGGNIKTAHSVERAAKVYCEECYMGEVY